MSSQHRNENTGQYYTVYCEQTPEFNKIVKTKSNLKELTNEELEILITGYKAHEKYIKNIRRFRQKTVQQRKEAEAELAKRESK